jgi:hypothetical protein
MKGTQTTCRSRLLLCRANACRLTDYRKVVPTLPSPPISGSELLVPITSWEGLFRETLDTGGGFGTFLCRWVLDGVAYFLQWFGQPMCTVLAIWNDSGLTHVESRGSRLLSSGEAGIIERHLA